MREKRYTSRQVATILGNVLMHATDFHKKGCPCAKTVYTPGACTCDAQTNGGDLVDEIIEAIEFYVKENSNV